MAVRRVEAFLHSRLSRGAFSDLAVLYIYRKNDKFGLDSGQGAFPTSSLQNHFPSMLKVASFIAGDMAQLHKRKVKGFERRGGSRRHCPASVEKPAGCDGNKS